ncbi:hypothetical protein NQ314_003414 [Rhamnusium bicolor]|uniref:Uncharacterized protein n=1 Tax=Rhamnusium bicolor TaxID=1586634 RepID=A0AAV8ZM48_9CUCU|nr:hypothetical protein NQ314_003414 [Rhamnusium bicolor]
MVPTMYVHTMPQQCKTGNEKYHHEHFDRTYDNFLRKEYVPIHHHNNFYSSQNEDFQRQSHVPLLGQNELCSSISSNKNEANAKLNLINCDLESGKSIILEIEKGTANCCEVNLDRNINSKPKHPTEIDKFYTEKTFVS